MGASLGWATHRVRALVRPVARPLTVCYHAASETWPHPLSLNKALIERHVTTFMRRGFRPVRAEDIVEGRGRLLHVTFDDAFASTVPAIEALAARGVPTTVFVCSGLADRGGAQLAVPELRRELEVYGGELVTLSWSALRDLAANGHVEIGSHTVTHSPLPELSDHELDTELAESKARIEDEVGRPCRFLAYPFGAADARTVRAAEAAGYEAAFLLMNGRWTDRYALPRIDLYPHDRGFRLLVKSEPSLSVPLISAFRSRRRGGERVPAASASHQTV
jgi:peptidoglycan/xylan/chitin deacetylase (PgdA/CDA1 family)